MSRPGSNVGGGRSLVGIDFPLAPMVAPGRRAPLMVRCGGGRVVNSGIHQITTVAVHGRTGILFFGQDRHLSQRRAHPDFRPIRLRCRRLTGLMKVRHDGHRNRDRQNREAYRPDPGHVPLPLFVLLSAFPTTKSYARRGTWQWGRGGQIFNQIGVLRPFMKATGTFKSVKIQGTWLSPTTAASALK